MKGQITLFMLLGLVILFFFGAVWYISGHIAENTADTNVQTVSAINIEKNKVNNFVTSCLEKTTKEAFLLAGLQGGHLYDYQVDEGYAYSGPSNPPYDLYDNKKVIPFWYSLSGGRIFNTTYHIRAPDFRSYPSSSFSLEYTFGHDLHGHIPFGYLPVLCTKNGTNRHDLLGAEYSCPNYASDSLEEDLEGYILEKTMKCISDSDFKEKMDASIEFKGNATVYVLFGEGDVDVVLDLPTHVELGNGAEARMNDYISSLDINFKTLYELAYFLLRTEASDLYYNLYEASEKSGYLNGCRAFNSTSQTRNERINCYRDGINISIIKDACNYTSDMYNLELCPTITGKKATFIVIQDMNSSDIYGRPYTFVLAIGNRPPVMEKISYYDYSTEYAAYLNAAYSISPEGIYNQTVGPVNESIHTHDIIVDEKNTIYILPQGIDPDEDYSYRNRSIMKKRYVYEGWRENEFMNSKAYTGSIPGPQPISNKDANYTTNSTDVRENNGIHYVNVTVFDEAGNHFTETIEIKVRCFDPNHATDYDYSNVTDPDTNKSNDCCNETDDYQYAHDMHQCDGACYYCDGGTCLFNASKGNSNLDCGACSICEGGNCVENNTHTSATTACNESYQDMHGPTATGKCCFGDCVNGSVQSIDDFPSYIQNNVSTHHACWNTSATPHCVKNETTINAKYPEMVHQYVDFKIDNQHGACFTNPGPATGTCIFGECV